MQLNRVKRIDHDVIIKNVLISTADKSGLEILVNGLKNINNDINILSTGGTYTRIKEILGENFSKNLKKVSDYTGQPEMQGGLVKTLDFKIYLGLLSETYNDSHIADLKRTEAVKIDMVVANLYPFNETIAKEGSNLEDARANIDIGGPCMIRAAAKNFLRVASVCYSSDYPEIIKVLENNNGAMPYELRFKLAQKAFKHTAAYDQSISEYLINQTGEGVYNG